MTTSPQESIDSFDNRNPDRNYLIHFECSELTCLCPRTGQPDFCTVKINYVPDLLCVELKSLKLYLWSFRNRGIFHEDLVNEIADHLRDALAPRYLHVCGDFNIRGGIHTAVELSFGTPPTLGSLNPLNS
ncbi:MAG: NADPH-dependent 7-cyano-7-deazaguanine reductase QueF [Planctomycetes bacterium]|nr:NADPH-dependent 7-cyano-7-deazaguanine reductase QueF [Planctomycetota bacterium]